MKKQVPCNSQIIDGIALGFSTFLLIAAFFAAFYAGEWGHVLSDWYLIMISPCPLVTDYLTIGGLSSTLLNAGACGMSCFLFMKGLKGESRATTLSGYFLVIAHCFYGLNFLNMWPCFLAPFLYFRYKRLDYKKNLHVCMFATAFSPFISELLFRYTQRNHFVFGRASLTFSGVLLAILFTLMLGLVIPAILPGAHMWHNGYNLYSSGLAFGTFGFFLYNFMYKTMGLIPPEPIAVPHPDPTRFQYSCQFFASVFFLVLFLSCIAIGYFLNGRSFKGFSQLIKDTGYSSDFAVKYGMPLCLINIGFYGILFFLYLTIVVSFEADTGFTGPTIGVVLASLTFTAMGQHPQNIWPIIVGYQLLYFVTIFFCHANGREITWSLSTQAYISSAAFATGLCPVAGRYGIRAGVAAGFICASLCTATSAIHGGFILYNGGFTAGVTALILLPILEHYMPKARDEIKYPIINVQERITLAGESSDRDESTTHP